MFPLIDSSPDHTERRSPDSTSRKSAGVAVCEHCRIIFEQLAAKFRDETLRFDVLSVDRLGIFEKDLLDLSHRLPFRLRFLKRPVHPIDRPEEIDRSRTRFRENI